MLKHKINNITKNLKLFIFSLKNSKKTESKKEKKKLFLVLKILKKRSLLKKTSIKSYLVCLSERNQNTIKNIIILIKKNNNIYKHGTKNKARVLLKK